MKKSKTDISALLSENRRFKTVLERIAKWFGEFPPSNRAWDDGTPMSYSAAFGSNGERDYMRGIALEALSKKKYSKLTASSKI